MASGSSASRAPSGIPVHLRSSPNEKSLSPERGIGRLQVTLSDLLWTCDADATRVVRVSLSAIESESAHLSGAWSTAPGIR